ncbi:MAG: helix-turn-helix domain-containing protein [Oscillospiraceae bacterium]
MNAMTGSNTTCNKRTYTVREVADILGISSSAAYTLVRTEPFKTVRIGTAIRISKASFDDWLDKQS